MRLADKVAIIVGAGQGPGEVGGPLKFNWENGSGTHYGSNVWIDGYLYLKH